MRSRTIALAAVLLACAAPAHAADDTHPTRAQARAAAGRATASYDRLVKCKANSECINRAIWSSYMPMRTTFYYVLNHHRATCPALKAFGKAGGAFFAGATLSYMRPDSADSAAASVHAWNALLTAGDRVGKSCKTV